METTGLSKIIIKINFISFFMWLLEKFKLHLGCICDLYCIPIEELSQLLQFLLFCYVHN